MSGIASPTNAPARAGLRLVPEMELTPAQARRGDQPLPAEHATLGPELLQVLVAGGDAGSRSRMLAELRTLLPTNTRFLEARETWEVLARAASSRMVVLTDDLGDTSTESLVRLLARKNPTLPVLAVGGQARASAPTGSDVANG